MTRPMFSFPCQQSSELSPGRHEYARRASWVLGLLPLALSLACASDDAEDEGPATPSSAPAGSGGAAPAPAGGAPADVSGGAGGEPAAGGGGGTQAGGNASGGQGGAPPLDNPDAGSPAGGEGGAGGSGGEPNQGGAGGAGGTPNQVDCSDFAALTVSSPFADMIDDPWRPGGEIAAGAVLANVLGGQNNSSPGIWVTPSSPLVTPSEPVTGKGPAANSGSDTAPSIAAGGSRRHRVTFRADPTIEPGTEVTFLISSGAETGDCLGGLNVEVTVAVAP